jgi:hypothetical protein
MKPQSYIKKHSVRIKFGSRDEQGNLRTDSFLHEEYADMESHPPKGWTVSSAGEVETKTEYIRQSWFWQSRKNNALAVEHETGIEIFLVGIGINIASAAIIGLATLAWKEWRKSRKKHKKPASFVHLETVDRTARGKERFRKTIELYGSVQEADIQRAMKWLKYVA